MDKSLCVVGVTKKVPGQDKISQVARGYRAGAIVHRSFPSTTVYLVPVRPCNIGKVKVTNSSKVPKKVLLVMDF